MRSLTLVALIAVPAFAQTVYSWEDADGLHYTDDPGQVPKQKKVEVIPPAPRTSGLAAAKPGPQVLANAAPQAAVASPSAPSTEREWRDLFINGRRRVERLNQTIAGLQASLPPRTECFPHQVVNRSPTGAALPAQTVSRCQINPMHDQIQAQIVLQGAELRDAYAELEQLERRASMEAVPREWRRGW